jgi:NACalpha-BTF3-like transcription factor
MPVSTSEFLEIDDFGLEAPLLMIALRPPFLCRGDEEEEEEDDEEEEEEEEEFDSSDILLMSELTSATFAVD